MSSVVVARSTIEVLDLQKSKTGADLISLILGLLPTTSALLTRISDIGDIFIHATEAIKDFYGHAATHGITADDTG